MDGDRPSDDEPEPEAEEPGEPADDDATSANSEPSEGSPDQEADEGDSSVADSDAEEPASADPDDAAADSDDADGATLDDKPDQDGDTDAADSGEDSLEESQPEGDVDEDDAAPADDDEEDEMVEGPDAIDDDYEVEVPAYAQVDGPSEDQEMPLAEHIEEMLKRLAIIIAIAGIVSLVTFPIAEEVINFLWNSILPEGELTRPRLYGILELKLTELKVASLAGLIVALPVLVHQTYQFMRPGLYPHERRYYLAAIPTSLVLALVGVSFAYFIILPAIFTYFLYYSQDVATIGFALGRTFDLILILMGYLAIVFQIPLFIMLAMMMGLVTRQWLADRRILFWGGFLGLSFIFSPDPTGMAPIVVALTMVVLFEGTLLLTKWTQGRS